MIQEWAETLRSEDPDRFLAILAAPAQMRERLFILAAFNSELARLAWVSDNSLIVQMRLQWWLDVVAGRTPPAGPLAQSLMALSPDAQDLERMISARILDHDRRPFETNAELWRYLDDTAGSLMRLGAQDAAAGHIGAALGLLNWFRAVPELLDRGHSPLPDESLEGISHLAGEGLALLGPVPSAAFAATLSAWQVKLLLGQAKTSPEDVLQGRLYTSEFRRRTGLLWRAARGRW